jgi:hypothetical protein
MSTDQTAVDSNPNANANRRVSDETIQKHVKILEIVAFQHGGVLPPYKWLNANGYFHSYEIMTKYPAAFAHLTTSEAKTFEVHKQKAEVVGRIMAAPKFRTLADYDVPGAKFNPVELCLDNGLPQEDWQQIGRALTVVNQSTNWWIGDFIIYGVRTYGKKTAFDLAQQATSYTRSQLYSCSLVARRFAAPRRVEALSFYHHSVLVKFPPELADRLLQEAVEVGYTARQVRHFADGETGEKKVVPHIRQVTVPLWETTYDILKRRAAGKTVSWLITQIVEEWITRMPAERYDNGRKTKDHKERIREIERNESVAAS